MNGSSHTTRRPATTKSTKPSNSGIETGAIELVQSALHSRDIDRLITQSFVFSILERVDGVDRPGCCIAKR